MVEQNNDVHRRVVYGVARLDAALQHWVHAVANTPGGVAPPPSLLEKNHTQRVDSDDEEAEQAPRAQGRKGNAGGARLRVDDDQPMDLLSGAASGVTSA